MTHELSPATNPAYIQTALREALQQPDLELRDLELLRHKPGRRALIAYTIARPGQPLQTLLGKQRIKGVDKHGYHIQRALWQQGFDLPGLAVPEALALLPDARLWLQRKAAGEPATRYLTPDSPPALWARIGAAIASLHRTNITTERRWNIADELALLHDRLNKAAALHPLLTERITALLPALDALGATLADRPACGIHRDCYPDQILVADAGALAAQENALQQHYQQETGTASEAIAAWTTLALARHIYLSTQFPERHHTTVPLLALCEQRLQKN